ncbi:phosphatidate cytidylyltransferase, mitochondrial [Schistocerca piceifrons]|uniref:phosphatidate cytidylyltransferase, mitochondrial n=1 Tax=Schistocerca piceifrons TaxID=274613 RepID=UPI001F5F3215|nr:phosphatidate cytidylyltransferase, mitochondrial [Schistocerca piceifrons]
MMAVNSLAGQPSLYAKILGMFPQNLSFAFAYGSGVMKQSGASRKSKNMIDLIFAVDSSSLWHAENIRRNPKHYSHLKWFGHNFVANFQEHWGARVYFNTLVPVEGEDVVIKYGIISRQAMEADLLDWCDLYVAGRLHKPVVILKQATNSHLRSALHQNLYSAVHAALLILPETFTETDFYRCIAGLSYSGDFRMTFGEDKNKVVNIVAPQVEAFRSLYAPVVKSLQDYMHMPVLMGEGECCCQDISPSARMYHLNQLPRTPQRAVVRLWNTRGPRRLRQDTEDTLRAISHDPECGNVVETCIRNIVWNSSVKQSVKGIATAGLIKSIVYSWKKIKKMLKASSWKSKD